MQRCNIVSSLHFCIFAFLNMKTNSIRAWFLASRPKTLAGALIPVFLGTALAFHDGCLHPLTAVLCGLFACGMQIAANFINDYYDFKKGTDRADRLGPERACAQGWITPEAMKRGVWVAIVLSCVAGMGAFFLEYQSLPYHGWELIGIGALCVVFCILYTTWLSYLGLGDLLVLVFFGWVPVLGTYYVQAQTLTPTAWVLGTISGLVIDVLLVINNYRDRDQDRLSGKRTIIVRWGEPFGRYLFLWLGIIATLLSVYLLYNDTISVAGFFFSSLVYLSLHIRTWQKMVRIRRGKALNQILGENSRNMLLYGILLSAAICFGA